MKSINKFPQNKFFLALAMVMLLVLAMRLWSFGDLLTFKMDQARDVKLIEEAYNGGVGELPLLGPRAAKTYLRLGPIFYYFEYLAMLIFGDQPWAVAVPDLIFSILTIPLFYYFLRQAFNKKVSFLTTVIFASSFFLNQYGRFAWNPNSIPFWGLVYFSGIYKLVHSSQFTVHSSQFGSQFMVHSDGKVVRKLKSKIEGLGSGGWLLVAVIGYGVASQLHFTAMLAYPLVGILFILVIAFLESWKEGSLRKKKNISKNKKILSIDYLTIRGLRRFVWRLGQGISWKYWLGAIAILGIMYLPVVLSEIYTHGDNWIQFKYALSGRGKEEFSLYAKIIQSVKLHSEYFWFSLSSWSNGAGMIGLIGFFGIVCGVIFSVWKKFQDTMQANGELRIINDELQRINGGGEMTNDKSQMTNGGGENRIVWFGLVFVWAVVMGLLYTKLAFNVLKPRYWLLEAPLFFILLAVAMEWLLQKKNKLINIGGYILIGGLILSNLYATASWYWSVQSQRNSELLLWDLKLKDENKIPYGQLEKVAKYISGDILPLAKKEKKDVCFYTTGEYRPVYDYIFEKQGVSNKNFLEAEEKNISVIRRISFSKDTNGNCLFVAIDHHRHRETPRIPKDHKGEFEKVEKREVGFVTVWKISRKPKVKSQKSKSNEQEMIEKIQETRDKQISRYKKQDTNKFQDTRNKIQTNDKSQMTNDKEVTNDEVRANDELQIMNDKVKANGKLRIINYKLQSLDDNEEDTDKKKGIKKPRRVERVRWRDLFN